ncbi:MAG: oxygenase MpaB family protein [Motilibacteraceae bacterium]
MGGDGRLTGPATRPGSRPGRDHWSRRIAELDPETDFHEIYRILVAHEFPWDMNQALSFALYRTYAVPSIGRLLAQTRELTDRTQKRYDDTVIILDAILEHTFAGADGRAALRRMNRMHAAFDIAQDDMRYVLSTFVVVPTRWIDAYGWRRLAPAEVQASVNYNRNLGRHMGIKDIPTTYEDFETLLDDYERTRFGRDQGAREVSDATLRLMGTFPPNHLLPAAVSRRLAFALMDDHLLDAFGYPHPTRLERALAGAGLRARSAYVRRQPPRLEPCYPRQSANVRSYPHGYDVARLGTFPVPTQRMRPAETPAEADGTAR